MPRRRSTRSGIAPRRCTSRRASPDSGICWSTAARRAPSPRRSNAGGSTSSTCTPAYTAWEPLPRSTIRSPVVSGSGRSRVSRACCRPRGRTRAATAAVPTCAVSSSGASPRACPVIPRTSTRSVSSQAPGVSSASPRETCSWSTPRRFTAALLTGPRLSTWPPRLCRSRTTTCARRSAPCRSRRCPFVRVPAARVPVTTVPAPEMVKERSTHSLMRSPTSGTRARSTASSRADRSSSSPWPVTAETATAGASASGVPANSERTWAATSSILSGARSARVITMMPWSMPRAATASR